jgi:hypothetical protein
MRKRRIEAKTRIAVKAFLVGDAGAAETCLAISRGTYHASTLLSEEDKKLLKAVGSETDDLPVGKLRDNWHPHFLPAKLEQLARYEATIEEDVKNLCKRLLDAMKARKVEAEQ